MADNTYHSPVLLEESVAGLNIKPDGIYVDVTFGGGGHSRHILSKLGENGRLFAFDQDADAAAGAIDDSRFCLIPQNFRYIKNCLRMYRVNQVDGILADLGVSSHQFDTASRGFSIREDGPLDMRMNTSSGITAADIINNYDESLIADILYKYGELRESRQIASRIVRHRPLDSTLQLVGIVKNFAPRGRENRLLSQVFQALRIEVNDEMKALEELLSQSGEILRPGGRLSVISYHSLEDRLVKNYIRCGNFTGEATKDFYGNVICPMNPVNRKVILPSDNEITINSRARSAKLRIGEKK